MVIVFDAQCLLCNGWVQFLLKRPQVAGIQFASMQGDTGRRLLAEAGLPLVDLETLLVVDRGRSWQHTDAVLQILAALGWPWRLALVARMIPRPLRDGAYRWIARNRYRFFGCSTHCLVPAPNDAARFLD